MIVKHKMIVILAATAILTTTAIMGTMASVVPKSITGTLDYGLDTDGDGYYEHLVIRMPYVAEKPGYYTIDAYLTAQVKPADYCGLRVFEGFPSFHPVDGTQAQQGTQIAYAHSRIFLEIGEAIIILAFGGKEITTFATDGSYDVRVRVALDSSSTIDAPTPTDWSYTTNAYRHTEFEPVTWAIRFTGVNVEQLIDLDGNGLFDILRIIAQVRVALPGEYMVSGDILKTPPPEPAPLPGWNNSNPGIPFPGVNWLNIFFHETINLSAGIHTINFDFPASDIRTSELDGPYEARLSAYYLGDLNFVGVRLNDTPPDIIIIDPPFPIYYRGRLPSLPGSDFDFYGDNACLMTQAYNHDSFDEPPPDIVFTGDFWDLGLDSNGNGLFDQLEVGAGVEVFHEGEYSLTATLCTIDGEQALAVYSNINYLGLGRQTMMVFFDGSMLRNQGLDGPYKVHFNVFRIERPIDPEADHTTSTYLHDQFEGNDDMTRGY